MIKNTQFKTYLFSYEYEGSSYVVEIKAIGPEDAKRRLARMQHASFDGELALKIRIPTFIERAIAFVLRLLISVLPESKRQMP